MRLWRVLPWDPSAAVDQPGGAGWFPRAFQGAGRHDNPERYGCLYVSETPVSAVAEALAPFRGAGDLREDMLVRGGLSLALAELDLGEPTVLVDLDEPAVLAAEGLRPSAVATRRRSVTQSYALRLFEGHPEAAGLRWWSTLEAAWLNVTLWDRVVPRLAHGEVTALRPGLAPVTEAAEALGLV